MPNLSCGIVGLPNVGKSTLFNALTANNVPASNYPFCTIDPNTGVVEVFDERLVLLDKISKSGKCIYATTEFVDIAGLVKGASQGEGLGNAFLTNIRETDAIIQVVRCFEDPDIIHVNGQLHAISDIETINLELVLADLDTIDRAAAKTERLLKSNKEAALLFATLTKAKAHLEQGRPIRILPLTEEELALLEQYRLLTAKKMMYVCNISEDDVACGCDNIYVQQVREHAQKEGASVLSLCALLEHEISQLPVEERADFLVSLGLQQSGLSRLIRSAFDMLGLITFMTTGEIETRAWTVRKGASAVEAAGKIHSDIAQGLVRAEVIACDDFLAYNGRAGAKEAGKLRSEGKGYIVQDGDVIVFLHH